MLLIANIYSQQRVAGTWAFPASNYLKASHCFHQVVFQSEELVIPVIFLQRGGPSDDENRDYLEMITENFHNNGAPFTFEFLKKVEIAAGMPDLATIGLTYKDQLIDDHTILNLSQSYKADKSYATSLGLQGLPYYNDLIQIEQMKSDKEFNAAHEVGHWLGLMHTFEGGCVDGLAGDLIEDTPAVADNRGDGTNGYQDNKDSCPDLPGRDHHHNYMDYNDDPYEFTPGQIFRMLNTFHFRTFGTIFEYSINTDFNLCMGETIDLVRPNNEPSTTKTVWNVFTSFF